MRKVKHPEKLYIQLNDENHDTMGMSFNDDPSNPESIDPNEFDKDTKERVAMILANAYIYVVGHTNTGERMKEL